jgi:hypothetical protein
MPRDVVCDTDIDHNVHLGRDEDAVLLVKGRRERVALTLPATNVLGRRIVVTETADVARTIQARTANWGADCLRVLPPRSLAPRGRMAFVFEGGYWQARDAEVEPAGP